MNTRSEAGFSRNSSVRWGTKIKGAIQVGHGLGDAIRGSFGASDFGPNKYTTSNEIAQRGRHEIAQGLARIKGAAAVLPSAPLYDRRHSYPVQQYASSVWNRRSTSADRRRPNPPTAADPFGKFYEQPYPAEQDQEYDPGFAGLGAGIDPATRKQRNDRIRPAFLTHPPSASAMETRYPASGNSQASTMIPPQLYLNPARNSVPASISSGNSLRPPSAFDRVDQRSTLSADGPRSEQRSARRRSLSMLVNRTRKSMTLTGKGKSKATSNESEDGTNTSNTRLYVPDPHAIHQARSAPPTPPPHQHESALERAGYDVLSYDAKDPYPQWPSEDEMRARGGQSSRSGNGGRLEPVRSMRTRS